MPTLPFSPELQSQIVSSLSPYARTSLSPLPTLTTTTLHALCLTSKSFHREAEAHLYASLYLTSPRQAHLACRTLTANRRLAGLVRAFWFSDESGNRGGGGGGNERLPRRFWEGMRSALAGMKRLERLSLFDAELDNAWILDPAGFSSLTTSDDDDSDFPFQLHEAKFHFTWDTHLVAFLATQRSLHTLHTFDRIEDTSAHPRLPLLAGSLPSLRRFDGTLLVALNVLVLETPLTNLQATVEEGVHPHAPSYVLGFLRRLRGVGKTLRALSVLEMPEGMAGDAVDVVAGLCPNLVYIGLIPLPPVARHAIYGPLMRLHHLHTAQFDLTTWSPHPDVRAQRAIACEVRTFCPQIRNIVFWAGSTRVRWVWVVQNHHHQQYYHQKGGEVQGENMMKREAEVGQWHSQTEVQQYPPFDLMWSLV